MKNEIRNCYRSGLVNLDLAPIRTLIIAVVDKINYHD